MISSIALIWYSLGWVAMAVDFKANPYDYDERVPAIACFVFAPFLIVAWVVWAPLHALSSSVKRNRHKQHWWKK